MGLTPSPRRLSLDDTWPRRDANGALGAALDIGSLCGHAAPAAAFLDALPDGVLQSHLLPALSAAEKQALRATHPHARELLNAAVTRIRVAAGDLLPPDRPNAAAPQLGRRFPALRAVEAFDCSDAPVFDEALISFLQSAGAELLAQLVEFDVKRCHYVGRGLLDFLRAACPRLARLSASKWTDNVTLHAIGRLSALQELDLGESDALDDTGLLPLRHLTALRVLGLQRCRWIGDAGCRALAQITSLEELNLSATDVGALGVAELSVLPRLRRLDLSGSRRVDDDALAAVAGAGALEVLGLRNTEVHNEGLAWLGSLARLRSLDLGSRFELDDSGLECLAGAGAAAGRRAACGALRSLTAGSFNLTRKPPPGFGASLERLTFGGGFANKNLDLLFPLPRLRSLHATGIDTVTDRVMRTVSSQTSLEELSLRSGYSLTRDGLMTLHSLANLSALSVSSCPAINDNVLAAFADRRTAARAGATGGAAAGAAPVACGPLCAAA
ncbi:hypothetical protein MNEG_1222 [Monoraphidium neglectum]|uniref:Uncharacterized protein n=1 Tax=Monoraphidium neglectum TaxID=145388 RepID=A0A0D2NQY3_9CHLO|nr:hypothetical protein MNEG_1222 [Monoraphidium neglectum]KIZ06726.1 hypothetical protein MNEG_1222 [Monoraphidium neglectum]|eukprot:XP_013905745.1 hypothetical protein MNEG_1222 [Monoraphidium neglectum]